MAQHAICALYGTICVCIIVFCISFIEPPIMSSHHHIDLIVARITNKVEHYLLYVCMYVCMYVYIHVCVYVWMYEWMNECMCVCIYLYMHVHIPWMQRHPSVTRCKAVISFEFNYSIHDGIHWIVKKPTDHLPERILS